MTIDQAIAPGQIMAEIAEIDVLLMQYEDWRALLQLESREKQGDAVRSISGDTLKALLLESLSVNPLFARRQNLLAELEKIARDLQRLGPRTEAPGPVAAPGEEQPPLHDDLTKISGIDGRLAKRLKILNVRSFSQIANWTADDVEYVSNTLGLDNLIGKEDWIGQAAKLAQSSQLTAPAADAWVHARNDGGSLASSKAPAAAESPAAVITAGKKPVAASAPSTPVVPQPQIAAAVKVERPTQSLAPAKEELPTKEAAPTKATAPITPTPIPPVIAAKPVAAPAAPAAVTPVVVDDSWKKLVPASPLAARIYKTEIAPLAALQEPPKTAPAEPVNLPNPAMPLAARQYKGAVLEPKHDGGVYAGLKPSKPLPASAYRIAATAVPAPTAPAAAGQKPPPAVDAATVQAAAAQAAAAASASSNSKAADILQQTLPPLPLRPSAPPAQPPVVRAPPAAAQSEALLLAVAAARSPLVSGAAPPPLPPQMKNGQSAPQLQPAASDSALAGTRTPHVSPAVSPPPMRDEIEPRSRQASVEARVTIKRAEEPLPNAVLRTPGGTEVYLGARRPAPADEFDGNTYAAYRGSIEEASVQIVRRPPAAKLPDAPPPLAPALVSAAQAAAKAIEASRLPVSEPAEGNPPAGTTMGRFLKALTGQ